MSSNQSGADKSNKVKMFSTCENLLVIKIEKTFRKKVAIKVDVNY